MTSVYTHQTPANLRQAVTTLEQRKPKSGSLQTEERMMPWERVIKEHPSATADGTDLMTRRIASAQVDQAKRAVPPRPDKSRHVRTIVGLSGE